MKKLLITGASALALLAGPAMAADYGVTAYDMGTTSARPLGTVSADAAVGINAYPRTNTYGYDLSEFDRDSRRMVSMDELEQYRMEAAADAQVKSDATVDTGPKVFTGNGISFLTGGVSEEERARLAQEAAKYDLKLVFASKPQSRVEANNPFYADIPVTIQDHKGNTVLSAVSTGPWFFAELPSGTYKVTAGAEGAAQTKTVRVNNGQMKSLEYFW